MVMSALDYAEIQQLLARYNHAIDLGDIEGWADCFTEDGVFQCSGLPEGNPFGGRHEGRDALVAYATMHYGNTKGRGRHWNANLVIEGDGQQATMRCYLLAITVGKPPTVAGSTGIYVDRLRKVAGAWRFVERHITIDIDRPEAG
jgi:3-phenylpropionate/cinnamic acid dioxygenase small subunit